MQYEVWAHLLSWWWGGSATSSPGPRTDRLSRVAPFSLAPPTLAGISLISLQALGDRAPGGGASLTPTQCSWS